jgi:hypothetical protein
VLPQLPINLSSFVGSGAISLEANNRVEFTAADLDGDGTDELIAVEGRKVSAWTWVAEATK